MRAKPPSAPSGEHPPILDAPEASGSRARVVEYEPTSVEEVGGIEVELPSHLGARLPILCGLVLLVHLWFRHHFESHVTLAEELVAASALGALLPLLRTIWAYLQPEREDLSASLRAVLAFLLSTPVLATSTVIVLFLGSVVSTVTVFADGEPEELNVTIGNEGEKSDVDPKQLAGADSLTRFMRWTSPFGQSHWVEVEGFQRHSFDLYPFIDARIRLGKDLVPAPSLLVRTPPATHGQLFNCTIEIRAGGKVLASAPTEVMRAAVLFGHERPIPADFDYITNWGRDAIVTLDLERRDDAAIDRAIFGWLRYTTVPTDKTMQPGMKLEALLLDANRRTWARAEHTVGREPFQDVLLWEVQEERP